ncbi:nucleotidyl transferase AbiEii/AbiGii toxin family protein [Promicromonospora kroppenstedtii]|uniref:nucleotidyl transferase AbiEii/AbiGii toxin family protein n=1 Tax=Promicromonospora kroppenstedtii TaxID=440482 RepID=UPI0004AC8449|nr:nucleotidyl transferase AbiEii/AbiGii toxin family protein [Promicromonospora kroppenstedtii]
MLPFHERLARIGLQALESHGFVLAGGYAISTNGIGNRPSADVDLFTNVYAPSLFEVAVAKLRAAFLGAGFSVHDNLIGQTFADFSVTDDATQETSSIQIGVNYREFAPARFEIGPVLDVRDAVAGKMSALWSRGETRDFIDIDAVVQSGRFSRDEVLAIGDRQVALPFDRAMLADRFRAAQGKEAAEFAAYEVGADWRAEIVARFLDWADEIDPAVAR